MLAGCAGQPAPRPPPAPPAASQRLIQTIERENGPQAAARVRYWFALIEQGKSAPDAERLRLANNFFNAARFTTDMEVWQQQDYWATPIEFLIKDAGDCEEFAIAKYFTLLRMGIGEDAMRITYVRARTLHQPHMVLAWYPAPDDEPLILDNIEPRILPAGERPDLTPVYSFNGTTLWLARTRKEQVASGSAAQLEQWHELQRRLSELLR
ncbi:MAG: transglutaminase-like cysteine peptidase [Gammaproteobacteria bacterium]|nr:transglutaminase-like cysteine peptidase [Gammaproteobacteria bacterium]